MRLRDLPVHDSLVPIGMLQWIDVRGLCFADQRVLRRGRGGVRDVL
jgi:hypothetical protein